MSDIALQMADELDGLCSQYDSEIAAELRRLHELNAELVEALRVARAEFDGLPHSLGYAFTHIPKIDAALAKWEASK